MTATTQHPQPQTFSPLPALSHHGAAPLRTIQDAMGSIWFVAPDVCEALDLTNTARALSRLDDDEKGVTTVNTLGGNQQISIINESGLYSLILRSRKPEAKAFKRWVTRDVLPAIRRDGVYIKGEETLLTAATPEQLRDRLQVIAATAAEGIEAKAVRGLNGLEERQARSDALKFLGKGRVRAKRPRSRTMARGEI